MTSFTWENKKYILTKLDVPKDYGTCRGCVFRSDRCSHIGRDLFNNGGALCFTLGDINGWSHVVTKAYTIVRVNSNWERL